MDKVQLRRRSILKILEEEPIVPVAKLAESLSVTMETIRKDLDVLEQDGLIARIRGGASLVEQKPQPIPYAQRQEFHRTGKIQVARAACRLVQEGESLLLEASTTTVAFCRELLEHRELLKTLTIVTNSLYIVQLFELGALVDRLFFLGGWVRPTEGATRGAFINECLDKFRPDKVFLGGAALDDDMILSAYYEEDMIFQQRAIQRARTVVLLLDKGKYPSSGLYAVSDLEPVHYLVTDAELSEAKTAILREKNVELLQA